MNFDEKKRLCQEYFENLVEELKDTHEVLSSCNDDGSVYLIPKGTADQVTYYGKPVDSYRISDRWNWYANFKRCELSKYIQCYNVDMPKPRPRPEAGKASIPRVGWCVAYYGEDHKYHHVYGDKFHRGSKRWAFCLTSTPNGGRKVVKR